MKRIAIITLLSLLPLLNFLPQTGDYSFKYEYQPNSTYHSVTTTETEGEMDIIAEEELLEAIAAQGISIPMKMNSVQSITTKTITGSLNADSSVTIITSVENFQQNNIINGENKKNEKSPLNGMTISATYKNNSISNINVEGDNITEEMKSAIISVAENMMNKIQYPTDRMKINDSFKQEIPLQIPVGGMVPIDIKLIMSYQLKKVIENKAYFDIETEMVMLSNDTSYSINATGTGKGNMIHDIEKNMFVDMTSDMDMSFEITMKELKIISLTRSKTSVKITY